MAKMKRIRARSAVADEATRVALTELDDNASEAIDALEREKRPLWRAVQAAAVQMARPWDGIVCLQNCTIQFPDPTPQNTNQEIMVSKQGSPTISIIVINGRVNGATSDAGPAADRARVYVSTGSQWVSYA